MGSYVWTLAHTTNSMRFLVLLACVASSSTKSVFHHTSGALVPALAWDGKSAQGTFLNANGVISSVAPVAPVVFVHAPAANAVDAPPATVHHANGAVVPADTPQVKAAKAAFKRAGGVISVPVSQGPPAVVSHANGALTPADTPAVQAAKASHTIKVQAAKSAFRQAGGNLIPTGQVAPVAPVATVTYARAPVSQGPPAVVSHANGAITPADTPAVQAAKASHTMKVEAAKSAFQKAGGNLTPDASMAAAAYARTPIAIVSPLTAVAHTNGGFVAGLVGGPAHPVALGGMVAHPNGVVVPAEPADVVAARHAHLKALVTA